MRTMGAMLVVVGLAGCSGGGVTPASGVAACATAASCGLVGQTQIQACAMGVLAVNDPQIVAFFRVPITTAQVSCLATAGNDCAAAKKCLNDGQTPGTCSGNLGPIACHASVLQSCSTSGGPNYTTEFDCGFYGETCLQGRNDLACGTGTCAAVGTQCNGASLQTCDTNLVYHLFDCGEIGAGCNPAGFAHCRGTGAACTPPTLNDASLRCDGDKLITCLDGQEAAFDCNKINSPCFVNVKGAHAACALGNACDPRTYAPTCTGTTLSFCDNGRFDTYDCASGGWTGCDPTAGGRCT